MNKLIGLAALMAITGVTPAFAQDEDAGGIEFYAGAIGGYDNVKLKANGGSGSNDGVVFGGVFGIQSEMTSRTVLGIEGEITGSSTKESVSNVFEFGDRATLRAGRDLFIGVRAGAQATPGLLVYAKGGYTNARASLQYDDGVTSVKEGDNLGGYRVGAGAEFGQGALKFRGEYRFSDYGNYKYQNVDSGISAQRHQMVFGAIYAF